MRALDGPKSDSSILFVETSINSFVFVTANVMLAPITVEELTSVPPLQRSIASAPRRLRQGEIVVGDVDLAAQNQVSE